MENTVLQRSGIYCIKINGIPYVGKDTNIQINKRIKGHLSTLKLGNHWNTEMQEEYNKTKDLNWEVLWESDSVLTDEYLCDLEIKYIKKVNSFENGFNKTLGGKGLKGIIFTEEQLKRKSENTTGSKNPMSKLSLEQFLDVVHMLNEGYNNKQIGDKFGIHDRYVSLIRNKRRYAKWFEQYAPDYIIVSGKQFQIHTKISDETVKKVYLESIKDNVKAKILAEKYNISIDSVNNIKSKRTFKGVTKNL